MYLKKNFQLFLKAIIQNYISKSTFMKVVITSFQITKMILIYLEFSYLRLFPNKINVLKFSYYPKNDTYLLHTLANSLWKNERYL